MTSSWPACRLTPAKRILPCSFAMRWASRRSSVRSARPSWRGGTRCPRGRCRAGAGSRRGGPGPRAFVGAARLRRDVDLVAAALEGRADEPLVVAALVDAGGVEEVHAEVGGALDDALVGGDHAAEGDLGDLQARLAELALADDGRGGGRGRRRRAASGFGVSQRGVGRGGQGERGEGGRRRGTRGGSGGWTWSYSSDRVESDEV